MACLRGQAPNGCVGVVFCDEEGCEFRRFQAPEVEGSVGPASAGDCVLQLRLRAGDSEGVDHTSIGPIRLNPGELHVEIDGEKWDASKGTNPETCRHWVLRIYVGYLKYTWYCWSCGTAFTELPFDRSIEKYRYNPEYDAWEFVRKGHPNRVPDRGLLEEFLGYTLLDWQWEMLVHVLNKAPIKYRPMPIYGGREF